MSPRTCWASTKVGWLHTLVTIVVVIALMFVSGQIFNQMLPASRYPVVALIMPGLMMSLMYFLIGSFVLRRLGLPVIRQR